ncbi:demethylmenaquinone methyltransferase/2-methoxy-6-polyprenyl-1,4-benzoquinol methylase [Stackebrandtia albiflava]|uniref:Demethylmenaquinone methyltransferase n=1 Tax=Stackebrandtia albiflava TaxID=406432 RepID=A0A562UY14_9ACTN|nr:demethylmenaquinone methyltransferase [Stackebrandtia albiflava]TWJ10458.1 demethylmenaquinone methyltransferase/2-methoxy-6-polyprenyl-1,4-benzoquinol methylase [Stackebrandtia albiflava]
MARASLDKQTHEVAEMFDGVARRYDFMNSVMSMGMDRLWRAETRRALELSAGMRCLDLGAGSGVSTQELAKSGAYVVGADISLGMLAQGTGRGVPLIAGDAMALPFSDESFDAVTISFAIRNLNDVDLGLAEMHRVLKPGGRIVVCEFATPTWRPFRTVYMEYVMRGFPLLAKRLSSNPDAYVYLAESVRAWPPQPEFAAQIQRAGFARVAWRNLAGGAVALHRGFKPPAPPG